MRMGVPAIAGFLASVVALGLGASASAEPADPQLLGRVSNNSIMGTSVAGEPFCDYYAPDGSLTSVISGVPQSGTWIVDGTRVCQTVGGVTGCSRFEYLPPSFQVVTATSLEGSGSFPITAAVRPGDQCIVAGIPTIPDADSFPGLTLREAVFIDGQGTVLGSYRDEGGGNWVETNTAGEITFNFIEVGREDGSVYLEDRSRGVGIQLDLYAAQVMYNELGQQPQPLYTITETR